MFLLRVVIHCRGRTPGVPWLWFRLHCWLAYNWSVHNWLVHDWSVYDWWCTIGGARLVGARLVVHKKLKHTGRPVCVPYESDGRVYLIFGSRKTKASFRKGGGRRSLTEVFCHKANN